MDREINEVLLVYNKYHKDVIELFIKSKKFTIKFWGSKKSKDTYNFAKKIKYSFLLSFLDLYYKKNPENVVIRKSFIFDFIQDFRFYSYLEKLDQKDIENLLKKLENLEFNEFKKYLENLF